MGGGAPGNTVRWRDRPEFVGLSLTHSPGPYERM